MEGIKLTFNTNGNDRQKECAKAWIDPLISEIAYGGSKGSAKSYTGCSLIFGNAFLYPDTRYFIARKQLNDLRKFTIPTILEVFGHWGLTEKYWNFNGQDSVYTLSSGSKVFLLEAKYMPSDPLYERFGSVQMTQGWIEEAGEFEKAARDNLFISCGRWKNDIYNLPLKLLETCNPAKNYLYTHYYKPFKAGTLPPHMAFIQAYPQDNKKLPPGYMENLERTLTGSAKQRLLFGNWEYDDDPNALISYDAITNIFHNEHLKKENANKYITADIARMGSDKAVIMIWRGFEVIEIVEFEKSKITELQTAITTLKLKHRVPHSNIIADEDGVGGGVVDNLQIKGFVNNSRAIKGENYQNLKTQCYYKYAERVNGVGVYISCELSNKQMETIIQEHEQIKSSNKDAEGKLRIIPKEEVKQNIGHSPDYTDTLIMREYFELTGDGPIIHYR